MTKKAGYAESRAELEEFLNEYYVKNYRKLEKYEDKTVALKSYTESADWFYQGAPLGYIVDIDGNAHYFINVDGLPEDIRATIKGGNANGKKGSETGRYLGNL